MAHFTARAGGVELEISTRRNKEDKEEEELFRLRGGVGKNSTRRGVYGHDRLH